MSATRKVGALDGMRVLAIAAVVAYHANPTWLPGGYLGVTVFFVLTGYLTTLSLERKVRGSGGIDYPRFLVSRVRRLLPTMLAVVGVTAVLCALFSTALLPKVKTDAIPALLFFENLFYLFRNVSYFAAAGLPSPLTHFWFLGVTMQFYLVWPILLLALSRLTRSRSSACAIVALLAVASSVAMGVLYDPLGDTARVYYAPDTRAAEFLVGAALALYTRGRGLELPRLALPTRPAGRGAERDETVTSQAGATVVPPLAYDAAGLAALVVIGVMMVSLNGYSEFAYRGGILLVALLTALFIGVVSRPAQGPLAKVVGCGALAALGARSFAVYLWHYPLLLVMNPATRTTELPWWAWALEILVILVVAEGSYRLFERGVFPPFRLGQSRPALALEALGVIAALVLLVAPISAEQTGVPTSEQGGSAQQGASFNPETDGYDLSSTYLAGTAFASAADTISSLNYAVDVETGATDANVLLIGDSVPAGAVTQYQSIFPNGWIDAKVGRQFYDGQAVYDQCVADGHGADVVVFSLGNNGVVREEQVRQLIDAVGTDKKVYFVTARVPMALQDLNNQLFWDIAAQYDNVGVIDWYGESAGHDEYFWDDGTHLRPEGAQAYVMLVRRAVTGR